MSKKVRVAIVGCGGIANQKHMPEGALVGICRSVRQHRAHFLCVTDAGDRRLCGKKALVYIDAYHFLLAAQGRGQLVDVHRFVGGNADCEIRSDMCRLKILALAV